MFLVPPIPNSLKREKATVRWHLWMSPVSPSLSPDKPFQTWTFWYGRRDISMVLQTQWCLRCLAQKVLIAETGLCVYEGARGNVGSGKVRIGGKWAQNLRLDCAPLNILSPSHSALFTRSVSGSNCSFSRLRTMAALQSELNFALEAVDKVPAIGVVREQERVLAPSADIDPRAPENQSALLWQHNFLIINSKISTI